MKAFLLRHGLFILDAITNAVHFAFIAYCIQRIIAGDAVLYYAGLIGICVTFLAKSFRDFLRDNA